MEFRNFRGLFEIIRVFKGILKNSMISMEIQFLVIIEIVVMRGFLGKSGESLKFWGLFEIRKVFQGFLGNSGISM